MMGCVIYSLVAFCNSGVLIEFIARQALYFYFTGFAKDRNPSNNGRVPAAIIFIRSAFLDIKAIKAYSESRGYGRTTGAIKVPAEYLGFECDGVFARTKRTRFDDLFCFYDTGMFWPAVNLDQVPW